MSSFFSFELLYIFVIMFGSMSFGETMAYYSPAQQGICKDLDFSSTLGALFNSLAAFLSIFSGAFCYLIINKIGRKYTLLFTSFFATAGWVFLPFAQTKTKFIAFAFRSLLGLTVGAFSSVCPLYITELSPLHLRSAYGNLHQFGVVIGAAIAYGIGIFCDWRLLSYLCAIPPGLCGIFTFFIPESPRHKHSKERDSTSYLTEKAQRKSILQKKFLNPLFISFALMFFQQYSGVNGLLSTLETTFQQCGSELDPSIAAFLVGLSGMIATGVSAPLVHKIGQRISWLISSGLCFATLLLVALNGWFNWTSYIPLVCLFLDNLSFGLGLGPIPWVITPELFPDSVRATATSIMTAFNWAFATSVMFAWPSMQDGIGFAPSVLIFSLICGIAFVFGIIGIPDTKGKEMGEIYQTETSNQPLLSQTV